MKTTEFIGAAERQLHELVSRMIAYNAGDPKRIQHLIKVHYFARMIGLAEHVDEATQLILEAAALCMTLVSGFVSRNTESAMESTRSRKVRQKPGNC